MPRPSLSFFRHRRQEFTTSFDVRSLEGIPSHPRHPFSYHRHSPFELFGFLEAIDPIFQCVPVRCIGRWMLAHFVEELRDAQFALFFHHKERVENRARDPRHASIDRQQEEDGLKASQFVISVTDESIVFGRCQPCLDQPVNVHEALQCARRAPEEGRERIDRE